jgi:hypothetical protein
MRVTSRILLTVAALGYSAIPGRSVTAPSRLSAPARWPQAHAGCLCCDDVGGV